MTGNYLKRLSIRFHTKVPLRIALRASKGYSRNNISIKKNFKTLSQIHLLAQMTNSKPSVMAYLMTFANNTNKRLIRLIR